MRNGKLILLLIAVLGIVFLIDRKNRQDENALKEAFVRPIVLTFKENHNFGYSENHTFVFLEQPYLLDDSYEPLDKGTTRNILFGIHHSDLFPKVKSGGECPFYQEKIFVLNGFSSVDPEDLYFFSSSEESTFHVANLSYYRFDGTKDKVHLRMTQSYHDPAAKELDYQNDLSPLHISTYRLENAKYSLDCIIGSYANEQELRPELKGVRTLAGFLKHKGKSYLLKGFSKKDCVFNIMAYDYDRRFLQSLPALSFKLKYVKSQWSIEEV